MKKKRDHSESRLQIECLKLFKLKYPEFCYSYYNEKGEYKSGCLLYKNANESPASNIQRIIRFREGLQPGVSDMVLPISNGTHHALFIEFKKEKGKQSGAQIAFQKIIEKFGNKYVLVNSIDLFIKEIETYLGKKKYY